MPLLILGFFALQLDRGNMYAIMLAPFLSARLIDYLIFQWQRLDGLLYARCWHHTVPVQHWPAAAVCWYCAS